MKPGKNQGLVPYIIDGKDYFLPVITNRMDIPFEECVKKLGFILQQIAAEIKIEDHKYQVNPRFEVCISPKNGRPAIAFLRGALTPLHIIFAQTTVMQIAKEHFLGSN